MCKWCSRNFDSGTGESTNGWAVCSERCRLELAESISQGKSTARDSSSALGCIVFLVALALLGGLFSKIGSHDSSKNQRKTVHETTDNTDARASNGSDGSSFSDDGTSTATGTRATVEANDNSKTVAEHKNNADNSPSENSSSQQALEMLRSTDPTYKTRAIMQATGL